MIAHNASVVEVPFDPLALYDPPDVNYVTWLTVVVDEVGRTRKKQQQDAEARARA